MNRDKRVLAIAYAAWLGSLMLGACGSDPPTEVEPDIFGNLGDPLPSATEEQLATFERGREVALRRFTPADGLGPALNVTFCGGCHEKPVLGGGASHYRDFLLVGDELAPDVVVPSGQNGVQRQFSLETGRDPSDPLTNLSATRNPIPFFGAGLLSEIPDTEILSRADPEDADGDGISGRPNFDGTRIGRFGRKAQTANLELFVRGPIFNHMGITSNPLPADRRAELPSFATATLTQKQAVIPDEPTVDDDGVPDPELSEDELFDVLSFVLLLAAPMPDEPDEQTERGSRIFEQVGCERCHARTLQGPRGAIPAYSDLLLHDMGDELADGFPMEAAGGREFRTQPLWGVVAAAPYLHDGRVATIDEAIRLHGGEAASIRDAYVALSADDRADLIAFLWSLGGRDQATPGLLPPGSEVPVTGEYGAPLPELDSEQRAMFESGRALFDRDFAFSEGVGPTFSGDACRSCHFDPVIGGAGPGGVDAMRQAPSENSALPRHATVPIRPEPEDGVTFFERRQTPTTLGLGLLERVPRETIEAWADPGDGDGDGIEGRPHILGDGRLGRFGWKASIPSVREFVRDAMSGELGMTVPREPDHTFGIEQDDDEVPDPEINSATIDAVAAFIELLAPPPRTRTDEALEDQGEAVFSAIGCAGCHRPSMQTEDGVVVRAYSDLLLHAIAEPGAPGVEEGDAGARDFRTPPLWGLAHSAPYFHDGRATTIEDAILAHAGEATRALTNYTALSVTEREALLTFLASL